MAAFLLPTEAAYSLVFYLTLPLYYPPLLAWKLAPALSLIAWSALTLLWGAGRTWPFLLGALCTAAFLLGAMRALDAGLFIGRLLVCLGAANASFVLALNAGALARGERILGWGITRQPILGGSVMAVCCLTSLYLARRGGRGAWLFWVAAAVMTAFILAMDSRGALLGFICGAALLLLSWPAGRMAAAGTAAACLALGTSASVREAAARLLLARGDSRRVQIWRWALHAIGQRPVTGHGLGANMAFSPTGFPHSLYLSLLFYSGVVGFLLFLAMLAALAWRWRRAPAGAERLWVACLGANALVAGLTDFGQVTKGPGPLWVILWLPVAFGLSLASRRCAADAVPPD